MQNLPNLPTAEESWAEVFPSSSLQEPLPRGHPDISEGVTRRIWFSRDDMVAGRELLSVPVLDVGLRGEFSGDICIPLWRDWETKAGNKKHGQMWGLRQLSCQYVGYRWAEDGHFECFPWRLLQEWWLQVMAHDKGRTWRREFATNTNRQGVFSVLVPASIAQAGVAEQMAAATFPSLRTAENAKTGVAVLGRTKRETRIVSLGRED